MKRASLYGCALLALAAALGGCATTAPPACPTGQQAMLSEQLYFGTDTPRGAVTPEQWKLFLDDHVTPRFPRGFSVWPAAGQWKADAGPIVREASYVLNIVHADDAASATAVSYIVDAYKERFRQEAVLRVRSAACVSL